MAECLNYTFVAIEDFVTQLLTSRAEKMTDIEKTGSKMVRNEMFDLVIETDISKKYQRFHKIILERCKKLNMLSPLSLKFR